MKLHESPSPNARRVTVFMAEKGIECEKVSVDIRGGENIQSEYLRKNPAGRVPVLELDDGSFISESMAICRYLDAIQPEPNLFGVSAIEIANVEMWQRRVELNLFSEIAGAFRNITGFLKIEKPVLRSGAGFAQKKRLRLSRCLMINYRSMSIWLENALRSPILLLLSRLISQKWSKSRLYPLWIIFPDGAKE